MHAFDPSERTQDEVARFVKTVVTPRPIAWISTQSADGAENLAPFSSYNYVSLQEPTVLFNSPNGEPDELKDTARNALETEEFVVNVVTEADIERMDHTSAAIPEDESEFNLAEVDRGECETVAAPRVADAAVSMECTLYDSIEIHDKLMILGDVQYVHVDEGLLTDGKLDMRDLDTVGRLGGPYYTVSDTLPFERQF
ncbi:flavin reductase family protein [Natronorubrum daqingense]|uniref:Flavin reductase n=1 Tax=Natronorubrum daqingense TaxID=588898 RepID=A0A1N7BQH2_9EURY|nr:flavin reductase family protein [Natronorubrum daqingense]APX96554.1 flavin reductase [Natronorubrum daqingense]SIR53496.1 NADH-FMN oxidoreductase RutF, flavin reductase (DIM6/NTAB) family [Natronorubrum daqingense]